MHILVSGPEKYAVYFGNVIFPNIKIVPPSFKKLKHVGITDSDRERLKMSVKTLASWSALARSTCPGNPPGPAAL